MHEVSGLGWDCSSSMKQVFTTLKVDDTHPTCAINLSPAASMHALLSLFVPFSTSQWRDTKCRVF